MTVSSKRIRANRRNARLSTGPRTPGGKQVSSRNATSHGIFCQDVLLPGENEELFHAIRHGILISLSPQDTLELMLVDRIVAARWRLRRLREDEHFEHEYAADRMIEINRNGSNHNEEDDYYGSGSRITPAQRERELAELGVPLPACVVEAYRMSVDPDGKWERARRYEQRLELSINRALRELRQQRAPIRGASKERKLCPFVPESYYTTASVAEVVWDAQEPEEDDEVEEAAPEEVSKCENEPIRSTGDARAARLFI